MTNTTKTLKHKGHLYTGGLPLNTFAPVLEHEEGLILAIGSAGTGKTTLINRLVEYERGEGRQREILSIDESTPIRDVDHFVFPTWHNQPKLQKKYRGYTEWCNAEGLDTVSEILERVMDREVDIIVIDEIRNSEIATLAVALSRHGYLVIAGIHGSDIEGGVNQFKSALVQSNTFSEFASGYEEVSGYNDDIVDIVLRESVSIYWSRDDEGVPERFVRDITITSYE